MIHPWRGHIKDFCSLHCCCFYFCTRQKRWRLCPLYKNIWNNLLNILDQIVADVRNGKLIAMTVYDSITLIQITFNRLEFNSTVRTFSPRLKEKRATQRQHFEKWMSIIKTCSDENALCAFSIHTNIRRKTKCWWNRKNKCYSVFTFSI